MPQDNRIECKHCQKKHRVSEGCYPEVKARRLGGAGRVTIEPEPVTIEPPPPIVTRLPNVTVPEAIVTPRVEVPPVPRDRGIGPKRGHRSKVYASRAEQQRAYRQRKRETVE